MAATLQHWNPMILTSEPGLKSLQQYKLPYILARDEKEAGDAIDWCAGSNEARKHGAVFFDSISALSENILVDKRKRSADPRKFSPETTGATMTLVMKFLAIQNKHRVMTCKATLVEISELPKLTRYEPFAVVPKLGPLLPYHFDTVAFMSRGRQNDGTEYAMFTCRDNERCIARNRSGLLALYEPADLGALIIKSKGIA